MSEITIKDITKEDTAWRKEITFEREGKTYTATLYWSAYDGYDLDFRDGRKFIPDPEWASEWQDRQQYGEESLEYTLDSLTEDAIEKSYL